MEARTLCPVSSHEREQKRERKKERERERERADRLGGRGGFVGGAHTLPRLQPRSYRH